MELIDNWKAIRIHFSKSFQSSLHVSIASVNSQNEPTVTPIGTFFLNNDQTGFYFEKFTTKLPSNAKKNKNICVLGVNSSKLFWVKSLFNVKFSSYPAVRLYGVFGERREATPKEIHALKRRMRTTKRLKGHQYLWGDMHYVRELAFTKAESVDIGKMTSRFYNDNKGINLMLVKINYEH